MIIFYCKKHFWLVAHNLLFNSGSRFVSHLLSVAVSGVLAVEAALLVSSAVVHPAVAVAVKASNPAFAVAVAADDATLWEND